jgi:hypothetical protein
LGDSGHLELYVELIGPKPGQGTVRVGAAGDCGSDGLGLVGGVLDGLETDAVNRENAGMFRAVADGEDVRIIGLKILVDGDAVRDSEAGIAGEFDVWYYADADEREVRWISSTVAEHDFTDGAARSCNF